jgi:cytochrome d ubiquinol oxidase subunit II
MQKVYNKIFRYSSFITPLFLGIIAGSAVGGRIDPNASGFADAFIFSWLNLFSFSVGLFTVAICGYLAAIFIIGEARTDAGRKRYIIKARSMNIAAALAGILVFFAAGLSGIPLAKWLFGNPVGIIAITAALISLIAQWRLISKGKIIIIRVLAGFQIAMILLATTYYHYPRIIVMKGGGYLSLLEHRGDDKAITALALALLIGSLFILPALVYLMYSFQKKKPALK